MLFAFLVSLVAGSATALGGLLALHPRSREGRVLGASLAFAAGAMVAVCAVEIVPRSIGELRASMGAASGVLIALLALGAGALLVGLIELLHHRRRRSDVATPPSLHLPAHDSGLPEEDTGHGSGVSVATRRRLGASAVLIAGVVALHNLPEGMSTFLATVSDPSAGVALAAAIAIHNVPEGIAVAAPVLAATGSRTKAFWWATASGVAEPVGALIGVLLVGVLVPETGLSILFALVGGMMLMLSLSGLLPAAARELRDTVSTVTAAAAGAAVMIVSLWLLG